MTSRPSARTVAALRTLIGFDTTSTLSNLALIDWAEREFTSLGAQCTRLPAPHQPGKAALWATFGPRDVSGWVLSGHTDTVPTEGQDWTVPPHQLTEKAGRFYGRGCCDMKGFLACCIGMAPELARLPLERPVHFAFSYDEELGCTGADDLVACARELSAPPIGCIVGEPTLLHLCIGHKAKQAVAVSVTGTPGHSARAPEFVNAIEYGARLIVYIQDIGRKLARQAQDPMYDPPHSTAHVGVAAGGTQLNMVPEHFGFEFEFRTIAQDDPAALVADVRRYAEETLIPQMRAVDAAANIVFTPIAAFPGVETPIDAPIVQAMTRLVGNHEVIKVAFGTEGGLFQQGAGIPTIICGPGSIAQAHVPDEFIEGSQLALYEAFLARLFDSCRS
ncbi:acetylornithine deacetylase [Acetobacter sp. TBRC 12305]|uniref:Acetylornithine deacetylase n=1 Tax=Acetobacter garciniae TaxID=2817435 RepID=A0A939KQL0_9PROT|nr:acetylornithine deacetylase [Acetobacter garciniae]MBO1325554.1 acetylornithine deacetylase [Acetobacter garciniae]MBX0345274.1 acetylornithine deacetylase [Acetobacter garciniae]